MAKNHDEAQLLIQSVFLSFSVDLLLEEYEQNRNEDGSEVFN